MISLLPFGPMSALQNRWYTTCLEDMSLDESSAQLLQPVITLCDDASLYAFDNEIPPYTLDWNRWAFFTNRFFENYAIMLQYIEFPQSEFEHDIGEENYQKWQQHLASVSPPPTSGELPGLFYDWASIYAPDVANAGKSDLIVMNLVNTAKNAILPYVGERGKPPDFLQSYSDIVSNIAQAPSVLIEFDTEHAGANVQNTWTHGYGPCLGGLWTQGWCNDPVSIKFAQSRVKMTLKIDRHLVQAVTPGQWYSSAVFNMAYTNKATPPWKENGNAHWNTFFGKNGIFRYLTASLLIADGITLALTSDAQFDSGEQALINSKSQIGYWPLYLEGSTKVSFPSGTLKIETTIPPGRPLVLGTSVLPVSRYLGHTL